MTRVHAPSRALLLSLALTGCGDTGVPEPPVRDGALSVPADAGAPTADLDAQRSDPDATLDARSAVDGSALEEAAVLTDASASDAAALDAAAPDVSSPAQARALVDHARWVLTTGADDPFMDRPPTVVCARAATMAEVLGDEPAFSVDTGSCNYVTAVQPALSAVAAGETLKVRLWHFDLTAAEPAQAHALVMLDGVYVLDERVEIPAPGGLLVKRVTAPRAIPAGALVHFHLHNHGANSWSLVEVSAAP
ncbi:MAG TPA: hypothetical protein VFZ61_19655 [Polyangiales bacterium]